MNFDFSDEQKLIRDQAKQLLGRRVGYDRLRAFCDAGELYDRALWSEVADLGWLGLTTPEDYGGMGLEGQEVCLLSEELGYALAPVPFFSTYAAIDAINLYGSDAQKARFLPGLCSGQMIGSFAVSESRDRQSPSALATSFANGRLTGMKCPVPDGQIADVLIVVVQDAPLQLCIVELNQPGVERRPVQIFDRVRAHAIITFDNAQADVLPASDGAAAFADLEERAAIRTAFEQVGGAAACIEMAVSYAMVRKTFGRLIGSYQAVKHRLADMFTEVELARSNAYAGAWALTQDHKERRAAAAAARLSATGAYDFAARENIQLHGGIGYTWEANCHFHFRRARLLALAHGPERQWVDRLVDSIELEAA